METVRTLGVVGVVRTVGWLTILMEGADGKHSNGKSGSGGTCVEVVLVFLPNSLATATVSLFFPGLRFSGTFSQIL